MDIPTGSAPGMPAPAFPIVPTPERIVVPPGTDTAAGAVFRLDEQGVARGEGHERIGYVVEPLP